MLCSPYLALPTRSLFAAQIDRATRLGASANGQFKAGKISLLAAMDAIEAAYCDVTADHI